jgi:hypothetical protein
VIEKSELQSDQQYDFEREHERDIACERRASRPSAERGCKRTMPAAGGGRGMRGGFTMEGSHGLGFL